MRKFKFIMIIILSVISTYGWKDSDEKHARIQRSKGTTLALTNTEAATYFNHGSKQLSIITRESLPDDGMRAVCAAAMPMMKKKAKFPHVLILRCIQTCS